MDPLRFLLPLVLPALVQAVEVRSPQDAVELACCQLKTVFALSGRGPSASSVGGRSDRASRARKKPTASDSTPTIIPWPAPPAPWLYAAGLVGEFSLKITLDRLCCVAWR